MAKLHKQKFDILGVHNEAQTTVSGDVELYLHYDTKNDFFYFDNKEIDKVFNIKSWFDFKGCKTKKQATSIIELFISDSLVETRVLVLKIGVPKGLWNVKDPNYKESSDGIRYNSDTIPNPELPKYLVEMLKAKSLHDVSSGITLDFERVMKLEFNGMTQYSQCNKDWEYDKSHLHRNGQNQIEWTQEMEDFLINAQEKINSLSKMVLDFFNAGDDVSSLMEKVDIDSSKLLGNG